MSAIQLDVSVLAYAIAGLIALCASAFGFGKFLLSSYDKRAGERDTQLGNTLGRHADELARHLERMNTIEKDMLRWQAEQPLHYVRREDYVRGQTVLEAKLDSLAARLESVQLHTAVTRRGD